jgi:hypothetical protein
MNFKTILALFGVVLFGAGLVMAISGATPAWVSDSRWNGTATGSDTTEGGNISALNISGTALTDKWAAYYGNVTGSLILGDATNQLYTWTWNSSGSGEVCLSRAPAFDFSAVSVATGADVDTAWSFTGTDSDSGANTFGGSCNLTFAQSSVAGTQRINHEDSTYETCVIDDGSGTSETDYAFCSVLGTAAAYNGISSNYEVMVPTTVGASETETYYFYAELD